jgi:hypothetical protein
MLQINIGKGLTMEVEPSRFNGEVMNHIVSIGLRNLLGDAHTGATAKAYPDTYIAKSRELAERKLENLYNGVVRVATVGGPKAPTDPVAQVILRLARKQVQKDKAKEIAAAPKDQRLAVLNKLATEYAQAHDAALRPRAMQIVALENGDEPVAPKAEPVKAAPAKKRR